MIRLEVDTAFNCRPNRKQGERKHTDGRLLKTSIWFGGRLADVVRDARKAAAAGADIAPGYAEVVAVRAYDKATFDRDPLAAEPYWTARTL